MDTQIDCETQGSSPCTPQFLANLEERRFGYI